MAQGSASEVLGALDLAEAWGWEIESVRARALLDRELGLLWGLTRRDRAVGSPAKRACGPQDNGDEHASGRPGTAPQQADVEVAGRAQKVSTS